FAASLTNADTTLLQRNRNIPANGSGEISAGTSFDIGGARIGVIASAGYSNNWRTRDALQQQAIDPNLAGDPKSSYRNVITDNRIIVNGLFGLGADFGPHRIRWTNLYIRDSLKQGRLASGNDISIGAQDPDLPDQSLEQSTYWFERQLINTQLVGEFRFGDLSLDVRGGYANSQRESPYERDIGYVYNPTVGDYVNNLSLTGQFANIAFSNLEESVYSGSFDLAYRLRGPIPITLSAGYAYTQTERTSSRYQFRYRRLSGEALPLAVAQERPDYLLSDFNIYTFGIGLEDISGAEG